MDNTEHRKSLRDDIAAASPSTLANTLSYHLSIKRTRNAVSLVLNCGDEYAAMELFDRLVASAKAGSLNLGVTTRAG